MSKPGRWSVPLTTLSTRPNLRLSNTGHIAHASSFPRLCELKREGMFISLELLRRSCGPIRERHSAATAHNCGKDVVEALMIVCGVIQFELRSKPQIKLMGRFNSLNQSFDRYICPT